MEATKYEFMVLRCHEDFIESKTKTIQKEGWELAGNAETKYLNGCVWLFIPFKKKIK